MRPGTFRGVIGAVLLVPALAIGLAASRPAFRDAIQAFVTPLRSPSKDALTTSARVTTLPRSTGRIGAESSELRSLRDDAGSQVRAPAPAWISPDAAQRGTTDGDERPSGLRRLEIASRDNVEVDRIVGYYARDAGGARALATAIERGGRYRADVEAILRAWHVPEELQAIAVMGSGFSPTATSVDGGAGLWLLSLRVARAYGLTVGDRYDERRAVKLSTDAFAHYLADLRERLGSWELAIDAFGDGYPDALAALSAPTAEADGGTPDFWQLAAGLPPHRRAYVARVVAIATVLANLDRLGFDGLHPDAPVATSELEVPVGTPIGMVARAAATSREKLLALNPEYLGDTVPDTGFAMFMHVPAGGAARAHELLIQLLYASSSGLTRQGDSRFDWGRSEFPGSAKGGVGTTGGGKK